MFCCPGFENCVNSAGERGLGILVKRTPDGLRFELQSRGIAYEDETKIRPMPIELRINVASGTGLRFCPWCGRLVQDIIDLAPDAFVELAKKHEKLLTLTL